MYINMIYIQLWYKYVQTSYIVHIHSLFNLLRRHNTEFPSKGRLAYSIILLYLPHVLYVPDTR